jgi:hypothetical protein
MSDLEEVLANSEELDKEVEQLLADQVVVDVEIYQLATQVLEPVHPITTFDLVNQSLIVDWADPASLPKRPTTHDIAAAALTQEWVPTE